MEHRWKERSQHPKCSAYLELDGHKNALVRVEPMPDGRYLWQFRKVVSYADSVDKAKEYVEAGAEYFDVMRRNPYAQ
jgi:hypothetical protein